MARHSRESHSHHGGENLDRWMVSYADFITLLFVFFVVMYAISSVNEGKYRVFGASLVEAFGSHGLTGTEPGKGLNENEMLMKSLVERRNARLYGKHQENFQRLARELTQVTAPLVTSGQINVQQTSRGLVMEINAAALFAPGEAELQSTAIRALSDVAKILAPDTMPLEIEGHTDNIPIQTPRYPSNWELSSARASSVARLFISYGVAGGRMTIIGSADNHPVASNNSPEGRARNRRITVTLVAPGMARTALPISPEANADAWPAGPATNQTTN